MVIAILHHAGTDPAERIEIEKEQEALRVYNLGMGRLKKAIAEKDKTIEENKKAIEEKDETIEENKKLIEELKRQLGQKPGSV